MNIPHDGFCILPWVSLEASPIGTVRPCCLSQSEVVNDSGTKITVGETDLVTIQNTQHMRSLRAAFLNGDKPTDCRRCWDEEEAGKSSKRINTLNRMKHMLPDIEWGLDAAPLQFLDLKLGNICNLKCRICGSWSSSTFATEEIRYQDDKKHNFHYAMLQMGRWPREQQQFWQDLTNHFASIRYLEFTGGEPFLITEHFDLLRKLADSGHAHHIEIHYNTNGTIFPEQAQELWQHFAHVEIAFSIDDVDERFEYQRSNARWHEVIDNIDRFKAMRSRCRNISLQCCSTVSIFNVLYLDQLAAWIQEQAFDYMHWNLLHDPDKFSIRNLPYYAKHYVANVLRWQTFCDRDRKEIDHMIQFMLQGNHTDGQDLLAGVQELDQRRQQSLAEVAPDLAYLIKYDAAKV